MAKIGKITLPSKTVSVNGNSVTFTDPNALLLVLNNMADQLDGLSSGRLSAKWNAASAPPTGGTTTNPTGIIPGLNYGKGDYIPFTNPSVVAANGHNYVLMGWVCTQAGTAGSTNAPVFTATYSIVGPF